MNIKRLGILLLIVLGILLIPWIAMQVTTEVSWEKSDFLITGIVLLSVGLTYEWIIRKTVLPYYRIAFVIALCGVVLLFWINASVGFIGNENQSINRLFNGVFFLFVGGAIIVRYQARGMAKLMVIIAASQFLLPLIGLLIWPSPETSWSPGIPQVFLLNGFFVFVFSISSYLFFQADKFKD